MLLEESHSKKALTSSSVTPSHSTGNISWDHSQPTTHLIGSKIRPLFSTESAIPPNGQQSGSAQVCHRIWPVSLHILSITLPVRWLIFGPRKTEWTFSKEITEKLRVGCGLPPQPGMFLSPDS